MATILHPDLYEQAKQIVYKQYPKHSAYRSGMLVQKYKEMAAEKGLEAYSGKKPTKGLSEWFKETWKDIGGKDYPVFRPTKRVSKDTPLLPSEIDPKNLADQIRLKQTLKGEKNLPPFKSAFSDLKRVEQNAKRYFGKKVKIYPSTRKNKKFSVLKPDGKMVHFGQQGAADFTKHRDEARRQRYLGRATKIKGDWRDDPYSPNNLAINLLWQ